MTDLGEPIKVLLSAHFDGTNPFVDQFVDSITPAASVERFSWPTALRGDYDLLHVHWPEVLTRGTEPALVRARRVIRLAIRLRLTRTPLVQTVHNLSPHDPGGRLDRFLLGLLDRATTRFVVMSQTHQRMLAPRQVDLIAHPHYRDAYPASDATPRYRAALFFGMLRPYKSVPALMAAFSRAQIEDSTLTVAGECRSPAYSQELHDLAQRDERITLRTESIPACEVADLICSHSLVVVPYSQLGNSGVLLLALSMGRPVLVPAGPIANELKEEVGADWIHTYPAEEGRAALRRGLRHALRAGIPDGSPDLSGRDWSQAGRRYVEVYRRALGRPQRRPLLSD